MVILGALTCCSLDFILTNSSAIVDCIYISRCLVRYWCLGISHTLIDCSVGVCTLGGAFVSFGTGEYDVLSRLIAS